VKNVFASFTYTTQYIDHANCPPMVAYFVSNTYNTIGLHWDFGDSATADNNPNPSHTYNLPGVYIVTLTAYGANGITIVQQDSLTVKGPYGKLYSSLLQACIPAVDTLHATASYAGSYTWDFGDGTVMTTQDTFAVHTFILPGLFTPALILTDSTGCQVTFKYDKQLLMDTLHVQSNPAISQCDTGLVTFNPSIMSYVHDSLNMPLNYHWNFGTGNPGDTANTANASFDYTSPGNYIAQFQVQSPIGCTATVFDTVHIVPRFVIRPIGDTTICIGGSAPLQASGAYTYTWTPASTLNQATGDSVIARPSTTTTYTVIGADQYNCFYDTGTVTVYVDTLPSVVAGPDVSILAGTSTTLDTRVSSDVISWTWSPSSGLDCTTCPSPTSTPLVPTTYTVTVSTALGCTSTATVTVRLLCSQTAVHIPNAFTPDKGGANDLFYPVGSGIKVVKFFQVYSRWGELLFSRENMPANDRNYGWNGTLNGTKQPAGTYVYMVGIECFTGENFMLKGTVELLR
jgi:gliding motility-associated-like protein